MRSFKYNSFYNEIYIFFTSDRAEPSRHRAEHRAEPIRPERSRAVPWKTDVDFCAQAAEMVLVAFATPTRFAQFGTRLQKNTMVLNATFQKQQFLQ